MTSEEGEGAMEIPMTVQACNQKV